GKPVRWPPGMDATKANKAEDFPRDIWQEANKRWNDLGVEGQRNELTKRKEMLQKVGDAFKGELRSRAFWDSFSGFDLLWGFLPISTAYKLATGIAGSE